MADVQENLARELVLAQEFIDETDAKVKELEIQVEYDLSLDQIKDEDKMEKVLELRCMKYELEKGMEKFREVEEQYKELLNTGKIMKLNQPG